LYLGYANLRGKSGRAHNVLGLALLDHRLRFDSDLNVPLRYAMGYLPKNGPVLRLSAGLGYEISDSVELVLDLIAPMVWITHDEVIVSMNVAAEIGFTL
jgi:hypothetical protein